jgi:glycosyltransferase involved in cell wall biosynthesis
VLDAFAHKTPVLALSASMTGFHYAEGNYVPFNDYASFERAVAYMQENPDKTQQMAENAYQLLCENNDWNRNYSQFLSEVLKYF